MSEGRLKIGVPKIRRNGEKSILYAEIDDNGQKKELFFTVDRRFEKYLTVERSDAFVTALVYYAEFFGYDIVWETPCTEQLIYQLATYYIPVCAAELPFMHNISLTGPRTSTLLPNEGGIATGFSCGVDSTYTVRKYLETEYESARLTHLLFTDCFAAGLTEEFYEEFMESSMKTMPQAAAELGLEYIFVQTRMEQDFSIGVTEVKGFGRIQDAGLFTLKYCAIAMALSGLLKGYYFSGGVSPSDFTFRTYDFAYFDIFTLPLITTPKMWFYSSGMEVSRLEKVEAIADWEFSQNHLQVCDRVHDTNCGKCPKCIRTMSELYAIGKLHGYAQRFPINEFNKNIGRFMAKVMVQAYRYRHVFEINILKKMKQKGKKLPASAFLMFPFYYIEEVMRMKLRNVKFFRKIYDKYHLDRMVHGMAMEKYMSRAVKDKDVRGGGKT